MAFDLAAIGQSTFGFLGKSYIYVEMAIILGILALVIYFVFLRMSFKIKVTILEKQGRADTTNVIVDWDAAKIKINRHTQVTKFELWKNKNAIIQVPDQSFFHPFKKKGRALFLMKISDILYIPLDVTANFMDTPFSPITNIDVDYLQSKIKENAEFYSNKSWWAEHGATFAVFGAVIVIVILQYITMGKMENVAAMFNSAAMAIKEGLTSMGGTAILPG